MKGIKYRNEYHTVNPPGKSSNKGNDVENDLP